MRERFTSSVIIVPPDFHDIHPLLVHFNDRVGVLWRNRHTLIATRMAIHALLAKHLEADGVLLAKHVGGVESVDKQ